MILYSTTAFDAFGDMNTACWQFSYLIVILLRIVNRKDLDFTSNKYTLGKWSLPCAIVSFSWLLWTGIFILLPNQLTRRR